MVLAEKCRNEEENDDGTIIKRWKYKLKDGDC
jgi:hypothetical protein